MLERRIDVLVGGGSRFFAQHLRSDGRNLPEEFANSGYQVVANKRELTAAPIDKPWFGTFCPSHPPFTLDHQADETLQGTLPTLAEMPLVALGPVAEPFRGFIQVDVFRHYTQLAGVDFRNPSLPLPAEGPPA